MVNELKTPRSLRGGIFPPEEKALETLADGITQLSSRLDKLERNGEIETRGSGRVDKNQFHGARDLDYKETLRDHPTATAARVIPLKEGVNPDSWSKISQLPVGASTPSGHKPQAKEIEVIGVRNDGKQVRWTETVQPEHRGVSRAPSTPAGVPLHTIYTELVQNVDPIRFNDVSAGYQGPTEATRGGVRTLQDSIDGLRHTFDVLRGKK